MKTKDSYKLNENFDLKGYNIILKKNSMVSIKEIFNDTIEKPTILALNVNNIPGEFHVGVEDFQNAINTKMIEENTSRFNEGDCVVYKNRNYEIETKIYHDFIKEWLYKLQNETNWVFETDLQPC
ncbi:hypothetical protein [Chryseobacterium sp. HMWF035]|uniref:hypothetical protein n=1 Tax=Chryseobacterium sp. HMWF035 TaxID=2056868 RepID=UPI000D57CC71|nr:hypothetical protein [Chryseobacterium sp. HMWF035]PVV50405.1 hypothetical protein DD829_22335 [Chryseobacterium sp. HMWF035]